MVPRVTRVIIQLISVVEPFRGEVSLPTSGSIATYVWRSISGAGDFDLTHVSTINVTTTYQWYVDESSMQHSERMFPTGTHVFQGRVQLRGLGRVKSW